MSNQTSPPEVLLVGSSPLSSAREFLTLTTGALRERLRRVPDGETGTRHAFIAWQGSVFPSHIVRPWRGGQPAKVSSADTYTLDDLQSTGYDDAAKTSFKIFEELRIAGIITPGIRFQVSLPTPLNVVHGFIEHDDTRLKIEPLYEARLLQSVRNLQNSIPSKDLTIQWDLPTEVAFLEYENDRNQASYWKPYFSNVKPGLIDRLTRLAAAVDPDVEMGYHLCYGDLDRQHFIQPMDMGLLAEFANVIVAKIGPIHRIAYIHMPVPKDRCDAAYFQPLRKLELKETMLFLGLVHPYDEEGTKERLAAARAIYPGNWGIGTECGLGRISPEETQSAIDICASVT